MIKQNIYFLLLLIFCFSCNENIEQSNALAFKKLLVNSKENPLTIESKQPLFSWIVNAEGFNKSQSAYHILVATSVEKLNETYTDVWNSNKVKSNKDKKPLPLTR